ncbi:hypothetical protein CROQUDRAFT_106184 [Cronartium quercuum f. sp. fusiforme G11]|uniref:Peroxisomal ATPase PEX1 N-terminal C-lobe domain-containing protein n=1 Tax=Cronartium quercuum f. sp. fusiforme G11 TaxID=708437 RepID=A0A9P6NPI2_9BASI|nr:hypothetical protein CROQUDRAFT_106184 [Cronartium quercuum f. sp. fusiforme G11]
MPSVHGALPDLMDVGEVAGDSWGAGPLKEWFSLFAFDVYRYVHVSVYVTVKTWQLYVTVKATTVANVANSTCLTPSIEDHFLTQICVLPQPQTLLVWLYGKMVIRVKVSSVHASHSSPNLTPHTPYLLINETEFKILPLSVFAKLVEKHTPSELRSDIIKSSSISPREVTANTCMFEGPDKRPVVRINPPAQPTKPVDQATRLIIAPRVRVVPVALVPIGYVSIPIQLQTRWFGSHHSAAACGHPGDYEG